MKKTLLMLLMIILVQCKKGDTKYCWECRNNIARNSTDMSYRPVGCNITKSDLKAHPPTDTAGYDLDVELQCRIKH